MHVSAAIIEAMTIRAITRTAKSPGGRPRAAEVEERAEHILQAAGKVFLRLGFDGATMDAIAAAARISKRTLYARYPDKTALFKAVLRDLIDRWLAPMDQFRSEQGPLEETLLALARHLATFALTPQSISANRIIIAEARRQPELGRLADEMGRRPAIRAIAAILRRHRDELRSDNVELLAEQFLSLAVDHNLWLAHLGIAPSAEEIDAWVCSAVRLFLIGVRSRARA